MDASELKDFIGKKVNVVETPWEVGNYKGVNCVVADGDETMIALKEKIGSKLFRVWFPDSGGTMDWKPDRVNVYIKKGDDGYRITMIVNG